MTIRVISETRRSRHGNAGGAQIAVVSCGQSCTSHVSQDTLRLLRANAKRNKKASKQ